MSGGDQLPDDSRTVLVVDDEEIDATVMARALATIGFRVEVANTLESAMAAFEANPLGFELAILDVSLPGKDGVELANRMRILRPDIPILFVSGWVGGELLRASTIPERDRHFLPKPFKSTDLIARVREILAHHGGSLPRDGRSDKKKMISKATC